MPPSSKPIDPRDRLIFALDVPSADEALALVERLGDSVFFYKIGLELWAASSSHYMNLATELLERDKKVMLDLKFFDVPATVGRAVKKVAVFGPTFLTVHGNDDIVRAAVDNRGDVEILAVTVLTSLDDDDLRAMGYATGVDELVVARGGRAVELGAGGVVASGREAKLLRDAHGDDFLIVTPGIRTSSQSGSDDQKRTVDVEEAFRNGADHIVVGRPIRDASDPTAAAASIQQRITTLYGG